MSSGLEKINLACLLVLSLLFFFPPSCKAVGPGDVDLDFHFGAGYRVDSFNWNIAGNSSGTGPNILSELTWSDVTSFQLRATARAVIDERLYMRGYIQGGPILSGQVQDSDFAGDNRTMEFSRSDNDADRGNIWAISGAAGYRSGFPLLSGSLDVMPLAGYSFHEQNLTLRNGFQTIPPTGPFTGLASTYSARWHGPFLGLDTAYRVSAFIIRAAAEYHYFFYRGLANWNLRSDFAHPLSFRHTAEGGGLRLVVGGEYKAAKNLRASIDFVYNNWETGPGNDRTFFANGSVVDTQLNVVNLDSKSVFLDIAWNF